MIKVEKAIIAVDPGIVVDPLQLKRQVEGGAVMGISHALLEEAKFDESAFLRDFGERSAVAVELGFLPCQLLPALDDDVDVFRVELHAVANPFRKFRGRERSAAAQEWVINQFTSPEVIDDWAPHEIHWLLCRMVELVFLGAAHDELGRWRIPDG